MADRSPTHRDGALRLLILGAHPDDAEYHAGGLAALYRQRGHEVKMISATDGAAGHYLRSPDQLRRLRKQEAADAGCVIGAAYEVWPYHDGQLQPTLQLRCDVIRAIRTFEPDLVLTHRTNDYHPDHRAIGQAVQDASYMVTVPHVLPEVPALRRDPVVACMADPFTTPCPLRADVALDVDSQLDTVLDMLACHASQVFEWLPYLEGNLDQLPSDSNSRHHFLRQWFLERVAYRAERYRQQLSRVYGQERAAQIKFAEIYEVSEYARPLDKQLRERLFGFLLPSSRDQ